MRRQSCLLKALICKYHLPEKRVVSLWSKALSEMTKTRHVFVHGVTHHSAVTGEVI